MGNKLKIALVLLIGVMIVGVNALTYSNPEQVNVPSASTSLEFKSQMINCEPAVLSAHFPINGQAVVTEVEPSKCYEVNN